MDIRVHRLAEANGIASEQQEPTKHRDLIKFVADRPGHDFRYATNIEKIERELDWQPTENLQDGLEKTVRWYLENRAWWEPILTGSAAPPESRSEPSKPGNSDKYQFKRLGISGTNQT